GKDIGKSIRFALERWDQQIRIRDFNNSLKKSEQKWTLTSELAKIGNWEMDIVSYEMSWTDEVYRIFELPLNSIRPTFGSYKDYIFTEDLEAVETAIEDAQRDGQIHSIQYRIKVGGQRIKHVENHFRVYIDETSDQMFLIGAIQDVSEQVRAQKIIREKIIEEQGVKVKTGMLDTLSFQIRTHLASVSQFSHLLKGEMEENSDLDNLFHAINDLSVSVNNLMNFSVLSTAKVKIEKANFNVENLVQRLEQFFQIKATDKSILLEFRLDADVPNELNGDEQKTQQILYNLIDNAIKFSPEGGKVTVKIENTSTKEEKRFRFRIADEGQGILPERIEELTDADKLLQSYEEDENNAGYGLAIVNKLIEHMEGQLEIDSTLGKGSVFTVDLPMEVVEVAQIRMGEKPTAAYKFLLVEDHFLNQIATKKMIQKWAEFSTIEIAENGQIGVDKAKNKKYDLILMDLQMPVMGGLEAAEKIREFDDGTPILALSANTNKQEADNSKASGMDDYLAKPYKPDELFGRMIQLLNKGR
ncbi:MAG: response regulator, partial [Bacteroidota bacterium]